MKDYVCDVVNYFNNLKGYMSWDEIHEFVNIVSRGKDYVLGPTLIKEINGLIEEDKGLEVYLVILEKCILGGK